MRFSVAVIVLMIIDLIFVVDEVSSDLMGTWKTCENTNFGDSVIDGSDAYTNCWDWCSAYYNIGGYCLGYTSGYYCACN